MSALVAALIAGLSVTVIFLGVFMVRGWYVRKMRGLADGMNRTLAQMKAQLKVETFRADRYTEALIGVGLMSRPSKVKEFELRIPKALRNQVEGWDAVGKTNDKGGLVVEFRKKDN